MRNLLWQSDAWKEYESLQAEKLILKKVGQSFFLCDTPATYSAA